MARETAPILLLGVNGQLGHELHARLVAAGTPHLLVLRRQELDLTQPEPLHAIVARHQPRLILNAAAYTAVDRAESEPEQAYAVNAVAPGLLAAAAERVGATLIHYSTDYLFDGHQPTPYREEDPPYPLSVYGSSKRAGEQAILRACQRHLILRTSWVTGTHGNNFLKTILRLAQERDSLRVVADQRGVPTTTSLLATITLELIRQMHGAHTEDPRWGIYHLTPTGETTWHAYACRIVRYAEQQGIALKLHAEAIQPIPTSDYPLPARRPANSLLNTEKIRRTFSLTLPPWQEGVDHLLHELLPPTPRTPRP
ncbi:MAG: dTDP-4-dehydrorhamnose reductase [Magnetococcales bacterium]|nr:dTDP-4-dehydrorhamnose reductase [Magnetococcales bacterium]